MRSWRQPQPPSGCPSFVRGVVRRSGSDHAHRALRTATAAKDAARGGQHGGPERYQSHSMKAVRRSQTASTETKLARYSRSRR